MFALPPLASTQGHAAASAAGGRGGGHSDFADTLAGALLGGGDAQASALSALHAEDGEVDPQAYRALGALLGLHAGHDGAPGEDLAAALLGEDADGAATDGLASLLAGDGSLEDLIASLVEGDGDGLAALLAGGDSLEDLIAALGDGDALGSLLAGEEAAEELAAALLGEDGLVAELTGALAADATLRERLAEALLDGDGLREALAERLEGHEELAALLEGEPRVDELAAALADGDVVASALATLLASTEGRGALEGVLDEDADGEVALRLAALLAAARSAARADGRVDAATDVARGIGRERAEAVRGVERGERGSARGLAEAVREQAGAIRAEDAEGGEEGEEATSIRLGQRLGERLAAARGRAGSEDEALPPRADRAGDAGLRGLVTASEARASASGLLSQRAADQTVRAEPSAMAARIAEVAEQLEKAGPPRRMTVEIGELRLSVSLRADSSVRVSVLSGQAPGEQAWRDGLEEALAERGLLLADDRGQRGQPDPRGQAAPKPASQPPRPAAFAASASDDARGLRL